MKNSSQHYALLVLTGICSIVLSSEIVGAYLAKGTQALSESVYATADAVNNISSVEAAEQAHQSVVKDVESMSANVSALYDNLPSIGPALLDAANKITGVSIKALNTSEKIISNLGDVLTVEF